MQMALCLQALARALMVNYQFTNEEYYNCAMDAWRMAISVLSGTHPKLALFRYTLGMPSLLIIIHWKDNIQCACVIMQLLVIHKILWPTQNRILLNKGLGKLVVKLKQC